MKKIFTSIIRICNDCPNCKCDVETSEFICKLNSKKIKLTGNIFPEGNLIIPEWCLLDEHKDSGVKASVVAIVVKEGKVLLGLRGDKCETARNEWAYPGGRMDYGEDPVTSILREVKEETGITIEEESLEYLTWINEFSPKNNKHYVSQVFLAKNPIGEPQIMEPDKCKEWRWFDPDELPDNMFWPCKMNIETYKNRIKDG